MLKTLAGIGCILIASIRTDTVMVSPDGDVAYWVDNWVEAEITSVTAHDGLYEPYYEVEVVDVDGWTYVIDDLDAEYVESNDWIADGHSVSIWVDDGYIEDMKES